MVGKKEGGDHEKAGNRSEITISMPQCHRQYAGPGRPVYSGLCRFGSLPYVPIPWEVRLSAEARQMNPTTLGNFNSFS